MNLFWKFRRVKKLRDLIFTISMVIVYSFSFFSNAIISISLAVFLGFSLIFYFDLERIKKNIKNNSKLFFLVNGWVIFLMITIFYSENLTYGLRIGFRYFNALLIGLVFFFIIPKNKINQRKIFYYAFVASNIIFVFAIYFKAILILEKTCFPEIYYDSLFGKLKFILKKPNHIIFSCFHDQYKTSFFIHRVYNSIGFLLSILILINLIFKNSIKKNWFLLCLYIILICFFSFLLFYQFSVVNVALGIILIPAFIIIKAWEKHKKIVLIGLVIGITVSALLFYKYRILDSSTVKEQSIPALNFARKVITGEAIDNVDERFEINQANKNLIRERLIIGYGVGDVQDALDEYYMSNNQNSNVYKRALEKHLNSHNNYAFLWLAGGLILLMLFLIQLFYLFKLSLKNRDWIFVFFLIIISFNLFFENVLSRISGLLFYVLFLNLFLFTTKQKETI